MMAFSYIEIESNISISRIRQKRFSLCPKDFRNIHLARGNSRELLTLTKSHFQGQEIGSDAYVPKSSYRFIKTVNITQQYSIEENSMEYCVPLNNRFPKKGNILIVKDGAGSGLGEVCYYNLSNIDQYDSISAGILSIDVDEKLRHYVLAVLKSQHFKDFVNLETPQGSTIRHSKKIALNYPVPFPTQQNNEFPNKILDYVSLLIQNIIDKEEQIKKKTKQIDELIKEELCVNTFDASFQFKQPTISEIKLNNSRLDTGLYGPQFKKVINVIKSYKEGYCALDDFKPRWISGLTPKIFIEKIDGKYWWIAVGDLAYGLTYKQVKRFNLNTRINNVLDSGDILITRKGATVGKLNMYFPVKELIAFVNEDLKVLRIKAPMHQKIFIALFLNSSYGQIQLLNKGSRGTKQGLTNANITDTLIPNFSQTKQIEIAKLYFNSVLDNSVVSLNYYLKEEAQRNSLLGIFQLNMEVFELRQKVADIVDKIIKNERLEIDL